MNEIEKKEEALKAIGFFIGGLTDDAINHYYNIFFN